MGNSERSNSDESEVISHLGLPLLPQYRSAFFSLSSGSAMPWDLVCGAFSSVGRGIAILSRRIRRILLPTDVTFETPENVSLGR